MRAGYGGSALEQRTFWPARQCGIRTEFADPLSYLAEKFGLILRLDRFRAHIYLLPLVVTGRMKVAARPSCLDLAAGAGLSCSRCQPGCQSLQVLVACGQDARVDQDFPDVVQGPGPRQVTKQVVGDGVACPGQPGRPARAEPAHHGGGVEDRAEANALAAADRSAPFAFGSAKPSQRPTQQRRRSCGDSSPCHHPPSASLDLRR